MNGSDRADLARRQRNVAPDEIVFNPEPYGPTYDMVMSEKTGEVTDRQDPHWTGDLLPSAHSRSDERAHAFFDATSVMG